MVRLTKESELQKSHIEYEFSVCLYLYTPTFENYRWTNPIALQRRKLPISTLNCVQNGRPRGEQ